ncbi:MAG: hypothetical protein GF349_04085 [Candidatus Magasanikbacteria bacterium]|nr:hypothetical protein [Candidatus Magasanikbacteria bacterium]
MKLYFDIIIITGIFATAVPAIFLLYHRSFSENSLENKFKNTSLILSLVLFIGSMVLIYGSFFEPKLLITNEQEINMEGINNEIEIILIADPQVGPYKQEKYLEKIITRIMELKPDIILIAGDIVNNGIPNKDETVYLDPLKKLPLIAPTYAVHGNHEYGIGSENPEDKKESLSPDVSQTVKIAIENLSIKYLENDLELIEVNSEKFYLFGGDSYWARKLDFSTLNNREEDIPTIALIHNQAAIYEATKHNVDLVLSGHTHGGQIRFPFVGPLGRVDGSTPNELYQGLHQFGSTTLFVSSGVGETGTRARLFNPPEIVLIKIN